MTTYQVAKADQVVSRTTRTSHAPALGLYFPEAEGAVADGVTPDHAAINAAITAAVAAGAGAQVELAMGKTYAVGASVTPAAETRLNGNGATIKWIAASGDRPLFVNAVNNVTVSDLTVDCGTTPPGSAVFVIGDGHKFQRVKIVSTATTGAGFRLSGVTNSRIEWCDVQGTGNAYNITALSSKCVISHSIATGTPAGVLINPSGTSAPSDIDVEWVTVSNFPTGVVLGYPIRSAGTSSAHNKRVRFDHCTVLGPSRGYIDGTTPGGTADQINAVYTDGYTVTCCISMYGGDMGISFTNCTHAVIIGNQAKYNTTGGIVASTSCSIVTMVGNICMNNGQNWDGHAPTPQSRFGIGVSSATNVTIAGNIIGDDQATATQSYGVRLQFGGDNITISANTYKGNAAAPYYTDGAATNVNNVDAAGSSALGKRAAYAAVTAPATASVATANNWAAFTGAPTITLPNDGAVYRIDLDGVSATLSAAGSLTIGLTGDTATPPTNWIKKSTAAHGTSAIDRPHMSAGNVIGSGQTITVWAFITAVATATLAADNQGALELWATRIA